MHVHDVWSFFAEQPHKIPPRVRSPNRAFRQTDLPNSRVSIHLPVGPVVNPHTMSGTFKKLALLSENYILTAWLLVGVMDEQYLHKTFRFLSRRLSFS